MSPLLAILSAPIPAVERMELLLYLALETGPQIPCRLRAQMPPSGLQRQQGDTMDTQSTAIADADSMTDSQLAEEVRWRERLERAHEAGVEEGIEEGLRRAALPDHDPLVAGIRDCLRLIPELMGLEPRLARELAGKLHDRLKNFDARARPTETTGTPTTGTEG
jgi:hypothetical protein